MRINSILKEVLEKVKPPKQEFEKIQSLVSIFLKDFEERLKKLKINAEIFLGGSFAKNTVIKKDHYDIDVFLRFNEKYKDQDLSKLTSKLLDKKATLIHGSRDYFRISLTPHTYIELVPVKKIKTPKEAVNITDLSYAHVAYIKRKVKSSKLLDEIRITKAFCYANNCYGAESYIKGFSGYALELLVFNYGSFLKFIKAMVKVKDKLVIDMEKHHKNKKTVLLDLNSSKLQSPVILIDPTFKSRNALAALSYETFKKFQKVSSSFLKSPSAKAFELEKTDLEKIKKTASSKDQEFILLEVDTNKQAGDIAGSKLLKFYNHIFKEITVFFTVKNKGFNYNKEKTARYFFVAKSKGELKLEGPKLNDKKNILKFRKKHKSIFIKAGKIYTKEKIKFNLKGFMENWKKKNSVKLKEMYITSLKVVNI